MDDEHKEFLDDLRDTNEVNMFGAAPYLVDFFDISKTEARVILKEYMTA